MFSSLEQRPPDRTHQTLDPSTMADASTAMFMFTRQSLRSIYNNPATAINVNQEVLVPSAPVVRECFAATPAYDIQSSEGTIGTGTFNRVSNEALPLVTQRIQRCLLVPLQTPYWNQRFIQWYRT